MKKAQQIKRARRLITGLVLNWTDPDPLSGKPHIEKASVSHRSPVLRLQADTVWREFREWIVKRQAMLWRIDITVVFVYPNGMEQYEQRRVIARAKLWDIASECEPVIKDALRGGGSNMLETRFTIECLGDRKATEADFEDYEVA